jgi:hypothetical protein
MKEHVMKTQRSFHFVLMAAALTVVSATAALPVLAEGVIADVCAVTGSHVEIYPHKVNRAVNPADALISHLRKAEVQLNRGAVARARSILTSSREYSRKLQYIQAETESAFQHINRSNETHDNSIGALPVDWVGMYSSLDEMEVYAPELVQETRERLKQAQMHATTGDIQRTAETLKEVAAGVPSSLQPGQPIDRQILLALELLGENEPDIATAKSVVENAINRLMVVVEAPAASAEDGSGVAG